MIPCHVNYL